MVTSFILCHVVFASIYRFSVTGRTWVRFCSCVKSCRLQGYIPYVTMIARFLWLNHSGDVPSLVKSCLSVMILQGDCVERMNGLLLENTL